jgi:hypothetical protein
MQLLGTSYFSRVGILNIIFILNISTLAVAETFDRAHIRKIYASGCYQMKSLFSKTMKKKHLYFGYSNKHRRGGTEDSCCQTRFNETVNKGQFAPLVRTHAKNGNISVEQALDGLSFLQEAPELIKHLLVSRHVGYFNRNTPFISTSKSGARAASYAFFGFYPFMILANPAKEPGTIFTTKVAPKKLIDPRKTYSLYKDRLQKVLKDLKNYSSNSGHVTLKQKYSDALKANDMDRADYYSELISSIKWLNNNHWLRVISANAKIHPEDQRGKAFLDSLHRTAPSEIESARLEFLKLFDKAKLDFMGFRLNIATDQEQEVLLHIAPSEIIEAEYFDGNGQVLIHKRNE